MDTRTRHALKKDRFAQATASSMSWLSVHRSGVQRWAIVSVAVLVVGGIALGFWVWASNKADTALGAVGHIHRAVGAARSPCNPGVYATAGDRAKAANQQFVALAQQYGWLVESAKAHYFAGVTYEELGQNGPAETELKAAAKSWDRNLSNLAKLALAGLYHQTNRDAEAIDLYNALAAKPSDTVSTAVAQLDLADLYAATGKQDLAKALWAKVKDADKDGAAGSIASQNLSAKQ